MADWSRWAKHGGQSWSRRSSTSHRPSVSELLPRWPQVPITASSECYTPSTLASFSQCPHSAFGMVPGKPTPHPHLSDHSLHLLAGASELAVMGVGASKREREACCSSWSRLERAGEVLDTVGRDWEPLRKAGHWAGLCDPTAWQRGPRPRPRQPESSGRHRRGQYRPEAL